MTIQTKTLIDYLLKEIKTCTEQVEAAIAVLNRKKLEDIVLVEKALNMIEAVHAEVVRQGQEKLMKEFLPLRGKVIAFLVGAIDDLKEIYSVGQQKVIDIAPQRRMLNEIFNNLFILETELERFVSHYSDRLTPETPPANKRRKKEAQTEVPEPNKEAPSEVP